MTDYTDLIARGITVWTLSGQYDDWAMTHPTDSDKDEYSGCWVKAEDAAAAIAALEAEVARLPKSIGVHLAAQIESAAREHRNTFPGEEYKAANIALGGLRRLASEFFPETRQMCNEDAAKHLRALTAPKHPTPDAPQPPQ